MHAARPLLLLAMVLGLCRGDSFRVKVTVMLNEATQSRGEFIIRVHEDWAPLGAARFRELMDAKFFEGVRFFRVIRGFVAQFGIAGDPDVSKAWRGRVIEDDPVARVGNARGTISFATSGKGTRTTQLFINLGDNKNLDGMGFSPIAVVEHGMETVDQIFDGYGEGPPSGRGPSQGQIQRSGNAYLEAQFPRLSYIESMVLFGD